MQIKKVVGSVLPLLIVGAALTYAAAPSGGYLPNAVTDPDCAPGDTDCFVQNIVNDEDWTASGSNLFMTGGNVGIGTDNPNFKLHVYDDTGIVRSVVQSGDASQLSSLGVLNDLNAFAGVSMYGSTNSVSHLTNKAVFHNSNTSSGTILAADNGDLEFYTSNLGTSANERMRITETGNVGIGTDNPETLLHVAGNAKIEGAGLVEGNFFVNGQTFITRDSASRIYLDHTSASGENSIILRKNGLDRWEFGQDNTTEGGSDTGSDFLITRMDDAGARIDDALIIERATGNLGIGTASPGSKISVVGLPSGTSGVGAGLDGSSVGAVCIMSDGDMYIDTDGVCN